MLSESEKVIVKDIKVSRIETVIAGVEKDCWIVVGLLHLYIVMVEQNQEDVQVIKTEDCLVVSINNVVLEKLFVDVIDNEDRWENMVIIMLDDTIVNIGDSKDGKKNPA